MDFQFNFTQEQLQEIIPQAIGGVEQWYASLYEVLPQYDITTIKRVAAFLAQTGHESGGYRVLEENLNYRAQTLTKVWPRRFPPGIAEQYAGKPANIANRAYGGRMGNGPEDTGDGWLFRGRGLIQITGRLNYTECSQFLFDDDTLVNSPDIVEEPYYAIHTACWFWQKHDLNNLADSENITRMSVIINGGNNGMDDRLKKYAHAMNVLQE
jgi:putative chitinase